MMEVSNLDKGHRIGNFHNYYEFNPPNNRLDILRRSGLLEYMQSALFSINTSSHSIVATDNAVAFCDLGCNEGDLTLDISQELASYSKGQKSFHSLGLDIDEELIRRAEEKAKLSIGSKTEFGHSHGCKFDVNFQVCNLIDESNHLSVSNNFLKRIGKERFDLISIFSTTMWIHIHSGDDGLGSFLRRVCSMTKFILIEPQPSSCYGRVNVRLRKMNRPEEDISIARLKIRNNIEAEIDRILCECNFTRVEVQEVRSSEILSKWKRNIQLYRLQDSLDMELNAIPNTAEDKICLVRRIQELLTQKFQVYSGSDSNDSEYDSIEEMWRCEGFFQSDDKEAESKWYKKSHDYWEDDDNAQATIDGILGGFAHLSERDIISSEEFFRDVLQYLPVLREKINSNGPTIGCECGAGIGRLTKGLLIPMGVTKCDLVETSPRLLKAARTFLGSESEKCEFICAGLQDFNPSPESYDIIWIQWVIAYLTDWDLVNFLYRMENALKQGGVIIIKDNTCNEFGFMCDKDDGDITRSYQYIRAVIKESGLNLIKTESGSELVRWQEDFPDDIWPVAMMALQK